MGYYNQLSVRVIEQGNDPNGPDFERRVRLEVIRDCAKLHSLPHCSRLCSHWYGDGCLQKEVMPTRTPEQAAKDARFHGCQAKHGMLACNVFCEARRWPECLLNG